MSKDNVSISVPDVLGLYGFEAKEILEKNSFNIKSIEVTRSIKEGQPEGGCRVVRQSVSGQDVYLVLAYHKWVCETRKGV